MEKTSLPADHLNTRARNVSYGDSRLDEYMRYVREFTGPERWKLFDRVMADRRSYTYTLSEWLKIEIALVQELRILASSNSPAYSR
ncbi:MAG: hypothetical protein ABSG26_07805 [Bryobacteraceae bacterium]